jgi:hypothetical protein
MRKWRALGVRHGVKSVELTNRGGIEPGPKVTVETVALAQWLREYTPASLRWVSGRLGMAH